MTPPGKQGLSAVLLAAGESHRMGNVNKLSLPIGGTPLLRRSARILARSGLVELVVVVGYQQEVARQLLQGLPARIVYNDDFGAGQMTSVCCGLRALQKPCAGIMICLSDQPLLEVADFKTLIAGFASCQTSIMVPVYQGQRGNPVVLDYHHREAILAGRENPGCRRLIEKHPELVTTLEMPNDHVLIDLDTPEAYAAVEQRLCGERAWRADISLNG